MNTDSNEHQGVSFYFVIGAFREEDIDDIMQAIYVTVYKQRAENYILYNKDYEKKDKGFFEGLRYTLVPQIKFWNIKEIKTNIRNIDIDLPFYLNKTTFEISQIFPSKETRKNFIEFRSGVSFPESLINEGYEF
jgi:hypothetical protein